MMKTKFVVCLSNENFQVSLEVRKLYEMISDPSAGKHGQIRVVDESGEDYLYPEELFLPISIPADVEKRIVDAA